MLKRINWLFLLCALLVSTNLGQDVQAREYFAAGVEEAKKGNFKAAIEAYSNAIKSDSEFAAAYSGRAMAYMRSRQYDLAITDISSAIALKPDAVGYYINRSSAFSMKKEYEKSLADLSRAIEIDAKFPDIYSARGNIYRQMKEYQLAIESFTKAIEIKPYSYFYYGRCMTNYDFEKYENAIEDCSEAITRNPKDSWSFYYRGLARIKLEQNALAATDLRKAIELNPNHSGAKQQLEVLLKKNKY